jgi:hypothetical protein
MDKSPQDGQLNVASITKKLAGADLSPAQLQMVHSILMDVALQKEEYKEEKEEYKDDLDNKRRLQLVAFYTRHDPSKVLEVDRFMLLDWNMVNGKLYEKYGETADPKCGERGRLPACCGAS